VAAGSQDEEVQGRFRDKSGKMAVDRATEVGRGEHCVATRDVIEAWMKRHPR
jgi:hypothetical protein